MAEKKVVIEPKKAVIEPRRPETDGNLFGRENYIWLLAGIAIIALGLILMAGGRSDDPNVFDPKEVYSTTRITVAPILILLGLGLGVFAIFRKPKVK
ncbi:MAG: DUF3098 domain-containing protein [Flavitalea sp.]